MSLYRRLLAFATLLAVSVVALGAWVRLSDAGLGCPDWPGCYGQWLGVPQHADDVAKAWKEMLHRYFAGTLGLTVFAICLMAPRHRPRLSPPIPAALAGLVVFQALLGMWTVTQLLKPLVVSAHLLGGMTTLALLVWLRLEAAGARPAGEVSPGLKLLGLAALLAVAAQIALGGWVSSNYAALACPDFPTCRAAWLPEMEFGPAFSLQRKLGMTPGGGLLPAAALTAIHWSHRVGALVVAVVTGGFGLALYRRPEWRPWGVLLLTLVALQIGAGIANVLLGLPLVLAVAHNVGAALLLTAVLAVDFRVWRGPLPSVPTPSLRPKMNSL